jgi:hypothetical protein
MWGRERSPWVMAVGSRGNNLGVMTRVGLGLVGEPVGGKVRVGSTVGVVEAVTRGVNGIFMSVGSTVRVGCGVGNVAG